MLVPLVGFLKFLLVLDPLVGINCTESADVGYLHGDTHHLNLNSPIRSCGNSNRTIHSQVQTNIAER
jgi:hypothetical protein